MHNAKSLLATVVSVVFIAAALIVFSIFLKKKSEKVKTVPLVVISLLFVVMEILKVIYVAVTTEGAYPLNRLPLHMCSMFLWACMLAALAKGKVKEYCLAFCFHMGLFSGGAAIIIPTDIIGDSPTWLPLSNNLLPLHSYLYHSMLIIFGFWIVMSGIFRPSVRSAIRAGVMVVAILTVSLVINEILGTSFSHVTDSESNLFYGLMKAMTFPLYLGGIYILIAVGVPFLFFGSYLLVQKAVRKR